MKQIVCSTELKSSAFHFTELDQSLCAYDAIPSGIGNGCEKILNMKSIRTVSGKWMQFSDLTTLDDSIPGEYTPWTLGYIEKTVYGSQKTEENNGLTLTEQ